MLLSTDTEIDAALYADLQPAIARAYQLTYQPDEASSRVEVGYFWPATTVADVPDAKVVAA